MFGLGAITFATPWALAALALLPVIWWLLRFTPPRPEKVRFPPFRLLLDLINREEQPDKTPWWLVLLRLTLAALVIVAVARPFLQPEGRGGLIGKPMLIVVDDGWAAAPHWQARQQMLASLIDQAERRGLTVTLAGTTPLAQAGDVQPLAPATARERAAALQPRALATDRAGLLTRLGKAISSSGSHQVVWLSDGLESGTATAFAEGLARIAGSASDVRVIEPEVAAIPHAIAAPALTAAELSVTALRAGIDGERRAVVRLIAGNGRSLSEQAATFEPGSGEASVKLELPLELRNEAARVEIADQRSAGAVFLLDDRWKRKTVGIVSGASLELEQPLLSPLYYVSRALEPYGEIREAEPGGIAELLRQGLSMLVLADVGTLPPADREAVGRWIDNGGMLLRFAGPRLAAASDDLVPIQLRAGGRALGSALSWDEPQGMAPFDAASPFTGLDPDDTVRISRQVLAEPQPALGERTWASLNDGTPLVTAETRGSGLIVLFHVTANADWSNLPLSGLFVEMLKRVLDLSPGTAAQQGAGEAASAAAEAQTNSGQGAWAPRQILTGTGDLTGPSGDAAPIPADKIDTARPAPVHPAGLYQRGSNIRSVNLALSAGDLAPISGLPGGIATGTYEVAAAKPLAGILFAFAFVLFLADTLAALALSGGLRRLKVRKRAAATAGFAVVLLLAASPPDAHAQSAADDTSFAMRAALDTSIAYVLTGNRQVDDVSYAGLSGLNRILERRTSVEPAEPQPVDIEKDEIVFFPLIYWPVLADSQPPSPQSAIKIANFMKNGGTIFFDTRDASLDFSGAAGLASPTVMALRRILAGLDVPPLEPVPPEHVLTKAFYLLQAFPGRWANGKLWVEASQTIGEEGARADGVSSIIIGANDYAGAWAIGSDGRPVLPVTPGGDSQREFAFRTGVNVVMYALTGNYKADQVHVPALLERLGQ